MDQEERLLMEALGIPSVNGSDNEGKMAEYLAAYFREWGVAAEVQPIDEKHANVWAYLEGEDDSSRILWNGHLDTVPYGDLDEWETDPAVPVIQNGRVYARGASDMKSGLCAMVYALCAYHRTGRKPARSICFVGTCDEEKGGLGAAAALQRTGRGTFDQILIGEPTDLKLGAAQKGCLWLELAAGGRTSHGAYPERGCSAVTYALQAADRIKGFMEGWTHSLLGNATANITKIQGGIAPNMIPDQCRLMMDIRLVPGLTRDIVLSRAQEIIEQTVKETGGQFRAECFVRNDRRAIELPADSGLKRALESALEQEGVCPELTGISFFTDASILAADTLQTEVLLFGPGRPDMAHRPREYVELDKYRTAIRVLMRMLEQDTLKKGS